MKPYVTQPPDAVLPRYYLPAGFKYVPPTLADVGHWTGGTCGALEPLSLQDEHPPEPKRRGKKAAAP